VGESQSTRRRVAYPPLCQLCYEKERQHLTNGISEEEGGIYKRKASHATRKGIGKPRIRLRVREKGNKKLILSGQAGKKVLLRTHTLAKRG